jgi:PAS domain-containing protein
VSEIPDASLRGYGQDDLLENAPCALALVSMDGTVEWSNGAFQRLSGLTSPRANFFRALSRAAAIFYETQIVPVVLLRGSVKEVALELVAGGKIRVPVFLSANLQRASDGTPTAIRLAFFEATERRLYERDLLESRKSAEQLADVVRRALDAIVTLGSDGRIQAWNGGSLKNHRRSTTTRATASGSSAFPTWCLHIWIMDERAESYRCLRPIGGSRLFRSNLV